jgi:hypothetical protein
MPQIGYKRSGVRAAGAGGDHYFQRGRARAEIRVTLVENAGMNTTQISLTKPCPINSHQNSKIHI